MISAADKVPSLRRGGIGAKRSPALESIGETAAKENAGIVPLGIPMPAGPGAISSVTVLVGQQAVRLWRRLIVLPSIAATAWTGDAVSSGACRVRRVLGESGIGNLVRAAGLLPVAPAVQFFMNRLADLG